MEALLRPVVVLHEALGEDSRSDEADALVQLREVSAALRRLGFKVAAQPVDLDLGNALRRLRHQNPACAFNLVESLARRGALIAVVPMLLSTAGIPFSGSGGEALNLSSQKILAKRWMSVHGIATPAWFTANAAPDRALEGDRPGWIVKSVWEHASYGLDDSSVVRGERAARGRMDERARELGGDWFSERYIDGREFNISMLEQGGEPELLPIAEMSFVDYPAGKPKIVGYAAKWDESASEYHATRRSYPVLPKSDRDALHSLARACWRLFDLRGYARVDIRMDDRGTPWVLEVNANPCLSTDAGFVAAASEAGIAYDRIIERILEAALRPGRQLLQRAG